MPGRPARRPHARLTRTGYPLVVVNGHAPRYVVRLNVAARRRAPRTVRFSSAAGAQVAGAVILLLAMGAQQGGTVVAAFAAGIGCIGFGFWLEERESTAAAR